MELGTKRERERERESGESEFTKFVLLRRFVNEIERIQN